MILLKLTIIIILIDGKFPLLFYVLGQNNNSNNNNNNNNINNNNYYICKNPIRELKDNYYLSVKATLNMCVLEQI